MKIAISNIAWSFSEEDKISKILSLVQVHGIEIAPTKIWDNPIAQSDQSLHSYRYYWNNKKIDIVALQALLFGHPELTIFDDEETRNKTFEYLTKIISFGSKLGAKALVFGSPKNRLVGKLNRTKAMNIAIEFFSALGDVAHKNNTTFCIEPNSSEYGCDFICNTDEGVKLVSEVANPGFRLHLDTGNMTLNDEIMEKSIDDAFEYLEHFHISEPFLQMVGKGQAVHDRIANHLKKIKYNKWVSIEMRDGLGDSNLSVVEESLKYVIDKYRS